MKTRGLWLACILFPLGFIACEGENDGFFEEEDRIEAIEPRELEAVEPPEDLELVANENSDSPSSDGAVLQLENTYQFEILDSINTEREAIGLRSLILDERLEELAAAHNQYMQQRAALSDSSAIQISHDNFSSRADVAFALGYVLVGENVAGIRGYSSDEVTGAFVDGWNNSPGHRENIIRDFSHSGVSVLIDPEDGTIYATQIFAKLP